jgi:hypothetical protein
MVNTRAPDIKQFSDGVSLSNNDYGFYEITYKEAENGYELLECFRYKIPYDTIKATDGGEMRGKRHLTTILKKDLDTQNPKADLDKRCIELLLERSSTKHD